MASIVKEFAQRDACLTKKRQQLEDDLNQYTFKESTPADFKGVDADEFSRMKKLLNVLSSNGRDYLRLQKRENQWTDAFLQAQLEEPNQLETLLDAGSLTSDVVISKKKSLMHLLQKDPKPEWLRVVANLDDMQWYPEDMIHFPIELCRAFISKESAQCNVRPLWNKRDADDWLNMKEAFYCHLIRIFFDRLTEEEKREATRRVHEHSIKTCPPGARLRLITASATEDGEHDLLQKICDEYTSDPLSVLCKDLRQLLFRSSLHRGFNNTPSIVARAGNNCDLNNNSQYLFPDLCYVFPTDINIQYHSASTEIGDDITCPISTGEYPYIEIRDVDVDWTMCTTEDDFKEKTVTVSNEKCCKGIQIAARGVKVHRVRVYGTMLLLF